MPTRQQAIVLRQENPFLSMVDIAKQLNVSKQRIHFILKQEKLPTASIKRKKVVYCKVCGLATKGAKTCNKCHFKYYFLLVNCAFCHIPFYLKRSEIIRRQNYGYNKIYCGRTCYYRGQRDGLS
jgi:hypothetical protein